MAALITQDEAAAQLRLDLAAMTPGDQADLAMRAEQASHIITDYLKRDSDAPPDYVPPDPPPDVDPYPPWDTDTVPPLVKAAMLIVLTALYDDRTTTGDYLPSNVTDLLTRWRDPALA